MENTKTKLIVTMAQIAVNVQNAVKYANLTIKFSFFRKKLLFLQREKKTI